MGRRAIERRIVMHNWHAIGRKVHIEFESVGAGSEPEIESGERILGTKGASAAVREDHRAATVKERHKPQDRMRVCRIPR
jgi:hypothetical protein